MENSIRNCALCVGWDCSAVRSFHLDCCFEEEVQVHQVLDRNLHTYIPATIQKLDYHSVLIYFPCLSILQLILHPHCSRMVCPHYLLLIMFRPLAVQFVLYMYFIVSTVRNHYIFILEIVGLVI